LAAQTTVGRVGAMKSIFFSPLPLALALAMHPAFAEAPFSFEKTPGQLPKDIVPKEYTVTIKTDVKGAAFTGEETITIMAAKPFRVIVLNSLELAVSKAELVGKAAPPLAISLDEKQQTLTLTASKELPAGEYRLRLEFAGKLKEQPQGLFFSRYTTTSGEKRALMTQFEATDARRMFPCWDEPVFRATFQLTAVVPDNYLASSNMPAKSERKLDGGRKEIVFDKTPAMATYLLALCAGEFEMLEDKADGVALRVFTTEGKREQARYALEATKQIVAYYNEYFGTKYPLPQLDQVSLASTGSGGMENWGCITYNDTAFLYDPATSSTRTRERVYAIVAHEIAHQWFGDLVTMAWWDNLWLNEGFASWMGTKATDHFNPAWQHWLRAAGDKETAMRLDARATTHPIQQRVENESQAEDAFDEITYSKGQSFLRMLEVWLGEEKFRAGLRLYMKRHAYGNTTTADLWAALAESSGEDVAAMAASWTEQPGFPLVTISQLAPGRYRITQERFTVHQDKPPALTWKVPVTLALGSATAAKLLAGDPLELTLPLLKDAAVKGNVNGAGYYRTAYSPELLASLTKHLAAFSEDDRLNVLQDTWALVTAARLPVTAYLDLVQMLRAETSPTILESIAGSFGQIDFLARGTAGRPRFHEWARTFLRPHLSRLGWDAKPGESPLDAMLRSTLIGQLGSFGDDEVQRETKVRFAKFLSDPSTLTGDLRRAVVNIAARDADDASYDKLRALAKAETSTEQKRLLYNAVARSLTPKHAGQTLALSLTDELVPQSATHIVSAVGSDGEQPERAWDFAKAHLDTLLGKLGSIKSNGYVPGLFTAFTDAARADELETFAKANLPPETQYEVAKGADTIRFHAELKGRILPMIDAWCKAQPAP
jgi:aminopeptidase N